MSKCMDVIMVVPKLGAVYCWSMQKLKDDGKIWCIFNGERKEEVLFPQDQKPLVTISQDLVDFWHNIKVKI